MHASAALLHFLSCAVAIATHAAADRAPPYFILTGDSTVATGGGWGDGFLSFLLQPPAAGTNRGKSGATTVSFRAEGRWDAVLASVRDAASAASGAGAHSPVVTMQFGHNDQKPEKGISPSQFQGNLSRMAREVVNAGGTPVCCPTLFSRCSGGLTRKNEGRP